LAFFITTSYIGFIMEHDPQSDHIGGTPRATKRPGDVKPPANWTNEPLPKPQPIVEDAAEAQPGGRNPVRYGDWELKGLAIDF
jgi:hypothetical protein